MSDDKYTHDNRLFIPNTGVVCKALLSWIANQGEVGVSIKKSKTMLTVVFTGLPPEKYDECREFINNFIK